ncbi:hypothetical protein [uncultured Dubosiella sp.]|uniref:hypothetical protein n=2 Tax=uncultured Dubosiella sp. TaxID=1937011 RepID=UPI00272A2EAB|nr:hypothetical protein [uncultured Dubosiella sp.]
MQTFQRKNNSYGNEYRQNDGSTYFIKNSISIKIHIVGYRKQGESIIFFIKCDEKIVYAGLVDYYSLSELDMVKNILDESGVHHLDCICWTHPDNDHSRGLFKAINKYANESTVIWIPENIFEGELKYSDKCSNESLKLFAKLKEEAKKKESKYSVHTVSDKKDLLFLNPINFLYYNQKIDFKIYSLAPSLKMALYEMFNNQYFKNNRSICIAIELGGIRVLLTGDIENRGIHYIPDHEFSKHIDLLKIPHHGSSTASEMINKIGIDSLNLACATVYRIGKNNLPEINIMEQYKEIAEKVFCTGKMNPNEEKEKYGVIVFELSPLKKDIHYFRDGNAGIWGDNEE